MLPNRLLGCTRTRRWQALNTRGERKALRVAVAGVKEMTKCVPKRVMPISLQPGRVAERQRCRAPHWLERRTGPSMTSAIGNRLPLRAGSASVKRRKCGTFACVGQHQGEPEMSQTCLDRVRRLSLQSPSTRRADLRMISPPPNVTQLKPCASQRPPGL